MLFKVDFEKTYDYEEWGNLYAVWVECLFQLCGGIGLESMFVRLQLLC